MVYGSSLSVDRSENKHFYLVLERQFTSSNMDDLIDSMARRQLAYRRFDVC
jgi:hypothetical protein